MGEILKLFVGQAELILGTYALMMSYSRQLSLGYLEIRDVEYLYLRGCALPLRQ